MNPSPKILKNTNNNNQTQTKHKSPGASDFTHSLVLCVRQRNATHFTPWTSHPWSLPLDCYIELLDSTGVLSSFPSACPTPPVCFPWCNHGERSAAHRLLPFCAFSLKVAFLPSSQVSRSLHPTQSELTVDTCLIFPSSTPKAANSGC